MTLDAVIKKYGVIMAFATMVGLGGYLSDIRPAWAFELAQTNKKLDDFACLQIVMKYLEAKEANDAEMMAYWMQQVTAFNCVLPS